MAKTKGKLKGPSRGPKATRVARKSQKVSWLAKDYPVLSSVAVLDDCPRAIEWYESARSQATAPPRHAGRKGRAR